MSASCSKEFTLEIRPNIFAGFAWTLSALPNGGSASATGVGKTFAISAAAVLGGGSPHADATGSMSYNNTSGLPILCNLALIAVGVDWVYPTPWTYISLDISGVGIVISDSQPALDYGGFNRMQNYPFTVPVGNHLYTFQTATTVVPSIVPPHGIGAQSISGIFSVL